MPETIGVIAIFVAAGLFDYIRIVKENKRLKKEILKFQEKENDESLLMEHR